MINLIKRIGRDERGNALMIAGAALPLLIGSVGLATDTIQWSLWKRQLQRAADSAAFAGSLQKFHEGTATDGVNRDLVNNNHLWVSLLGTYPQISEPADTANVTNAVEVTLAVQQDLSFSSMFMPNAPTITATGRAGGVASGEFCVVALEKENNSGIIIQGSATVNMGCGMISNSPAASISVGVNGNAHNVTAEPVAGVGGVPDINGVTNEVSNHLPQPDPYEDKYDTDIPAGTSCGNMNANKDNAASTNQLTVLKPGCYTGNNSFKFTNGNYELKPGVYYLNNADFDAQGGTITGDGVTIILTGSTPGQLKLNGNSTVDLTAPTTGAFANMLLIQSEAASASNNANIVNGTANSNFDGAFYFPKQSVKFSGNNGAITKCAMVVAKKVEFEGNANLQNNVTGCVANTQVTGFAVRLLA